MKCRKLVVVLGVTALIVVLGTANSSSVGAASSLCGACDSTFGVDGDGLALGFAGLAYEAVVQPDGKTLLLVGGQDELSVTVERLNVDGSPDYGFGGNGIDGIAELSFHPDSLNEYPSAMTLAPDLNPPENPIAGAPEDFDIVISGWIRLAATSNNSKGKGKKNSNSIIDHMVVARLNSDGSMETGFGTYGVLILDAGSNQPADTGIAVDSEGRILVSARFGFEGALFRVDPHGPGRDLFQDVSVLMGSIAVVSSEPYVDYVVGQGGGTVVRWTKDGEIDPNFAPIDVPGIRIHMAVSPIDGSVFVASVLQVETGKGRNKTRTETVAVSQYDANGGLLSEFVPYDGGGSESLMDLEIDPEGRVVAVVRSFDDMGNDFEIKAIVRWDPDDPLREPDVLPYFLPADAGTLFEDVIVFSVAFGLVSRPEENPVKVMVLGGSHWPTGRPAAIRMFR